jgi:hypothetical protein
MSDTDTRPEWEVALVAEAQQSTRILGMKDTRCLPAACTTGKQRLA